jgi:class 3 adenylate cyclase/tetratricopeptide (TPR) repeat protein
MASTQTVTVLFTDMARSTALSSSLSADAADDVRRTHFALLRQSIAESGGDEVKNTGDGLMVTFSSTAAAIDCAVAMQQRVHAQGSAATGPIGLRVGISHGEALAEEGDWYGPCVVEASRLCDLANERQILVHDMVRMLVQARGSHEFEPRGAHDLKGLPAPVPVSAALWRPLDETGAGEQLPLPRRLEPPADGGFFGRRRELAELLIAFDGAAAGTVRIALVAGEPGIGKTRLCSELAQAAHARGAGVVYGRCDEELALPYQPVVEALRDLVAHASPSVLARHADASGGDLAPLVPELARRLPGIAVRAPGDAESGRYMAFAASDSLLSAASERGPLVIVLDDLHWADRATVAMLRYLISAPAPKALLIVCTFRSSELPADHPLSELRADLHADGGITRVELEGLSHAELEDLVAAAAGEELGEDGRLLTAALRRETDGNPLFVRELLRHLYETGAIQRVSGRWIARRDLAVIDLPGSVAEIVSRRVARLGESAAEVLSAAAVIGREFDLELLARAVDREEDELLDVLDAAIHGALIAELPAAEPRYGFVHALIEQALYESLRAGRRQRVHRRVALALEEICGNRPGARVAELAQHWVAAAASDPAKAIEYAAGAGRHAIQQLAPADGARWFGTAIDLLERHPAAGDDATRLDLLLGLGEAQRDGGQPAFRETLLEAARLASETGDDAGIVRAALANNRGLVSASGQVDAERVAVLEAALRVVGNGDSSDRALLMATLAAEFAFSAADLDRRHALSDDALAMARRLDDPDALNKVLYLRFVTIWNPDTLPERLANTDEGVALAESAGDAADQCRNVHWRGVALVEAGRMQEAIRDIDAATALAERLRQPTLRWLAAYDRANVAMLAGRLEEGEQLAGEAFQIGLDSSQPDALSFYAAQITSIRFDQGRLGEMHPLVAQTVEQNPGIPGWRSILALASTESGHMDDARALLRAESASGFADLPYDLVWLNGMAIWALVCAELADAEAAAVLRRRLLPLADQFVFSGVSGWGAVSLHLGGLARVLGNHDESLDHLAKATALHEAMAVPVWSARTALETARSLAARGTDADRRRAVALLDGMIASARDLGAQALERRAASLQAELTNHQAVETT